MKSIFEEINQGANKQKGVEAEALEAAWNAAGNPRDPQSIVDLLKKHGLDGEQIAVIFKHAGMSIKQTGQGEEGAESLAPESVEKIQKYLATMSAQELQQLSNNVNNVKVLSKKNLASLDQGAKSVG